jgi:peptidoglycan-associated lipoprotein
MNAWKTIWIGGGAVAALALGGCAHQQETKVDEAPPPAQVVQPAKPAPAPEAEAAPSQANQDLESLLRGTVIHFDFNEDLLTPESRDRLTKISEVMREHKDAHIKISGNCDERGTEEYNIALGQRRADVARKYLVSLGVTPRQLDTVSYGKEKPANPGHDETAWAANRRDEFQP